MTTPRSLCTAVSIAALAAGALGCGSYQAKGPLEFRDVAYTSADGRAWPERRIRLPGVEKAYGIRTPLTVEYVELNPGGARTVVFIHGLGSNLKFWRYQLDAFAARGFHVIALDLPGYGKSDKPASFPYTMESMADAVRELCGALGVKRPILVGHSMGGQTALSFGIRWPDEPAALVLTSPAGFESFSPSEREWFRRVVTARGIKRASEYGIWGSIRHNNFQRWRPEFEWLIEDRARVAGSKEFDSYAYANVRSVAGLADNEFIRKSLGRIKAPTLIVFGEDDGLIPNPFLHGGDTAGVMEHGHAGIAGSKLVPLDGCGHMVQMDCTREYNDAVWGFLDGLSRR
ncbi:MAG: alpha/beta fold hydrolase [Polyangiaceae bacterium]|nr:alpha/beta fold hydrolase [Polyangiaceae bacterium]